MVESEHKTQVLILLVGIYYTAFPVNKEIVQKMLKYIWGRLTSLFSKGSSASGQEIRVRPRDWQMNIFVLNHSKVSSVPL